MKRVLRFQDVQDRTGLSRPTLYNRINPKAPQYDPSFPKPFSLGGGKVGFLEEEIEAWIEARAASRQPAAIAA